GGAIAITRDWEPYVRWDRDQGYGELGGYAGDGMTMTYLAGKVMAAEVLDTPSKIRELRFVNRRSRNWEFEPIRYLAINALIKLTDLSDLEERVTNKPSQIKRIIEPLTLR
ncbi:MAG: amino acid oxidase, partial [Acidobacteria bacterium]|nr:amino acid oxidase [Acidobacteriota bacterium]